MNPNCLVPGRVPQDPAFPRPGVVRLSLRRPPDQAEAELWKSGANVIKLFTTVSYDFS